MKNRRIVLCLVGVAVVVGVVGLGRVWHERSVAGANSDAPYDNAQPACGHLCVARVCQLLGANVPLDEIRQRMPTEDGTHSFLDLAKQLETIGFSCEGRRTTLDELAPTGAGGVVYIAALTQPDHFIVLHSIDKRGLHVFDNLGSRTILRPEEFAARWTGAVLRVEKNAHAVVPAYHRLRPKSPRLQVDKLYFDKGSIPYTGNPIAFEYVLRNAGDGELLLYDVHRSCRCITATLTGRRLRPGESASLQLAYSADRPEGGFIQEAVLRSNDPIDPVLPLSAAGYLYSGVWGLPQHINFCTVAAGDVGRRYLFIGYAEGSDFQILGVSSTVDSVTARPCSWEQAMSGGVMQGLQRELRVHPASLPAQVIEVTYSPPAHAPPAALNGEIVVRTNVKEFEALHFPVVGLVEPRVRSFPPVLSFGLLEESGDTATRWLELVDVGGDDFELLAVDAGNLKHQHAARSNQGRLRVDLSAVSSSLLGQTERTVRFQIRSRGGSAEVLVPVFSWPRSG